MADSLRRRRSGGFAASSPPASRTGWARAGLASILVLGACGPPEPRPLEVGMESCEVCRMAVEEEAFATQVLTDRGRTYFFDSVECLARYLDHEGGVAETRAAWTTDFLEPGRWLEAEEAAYLQGEEVRSPMGLGLAAFSSPTEAERLMEAEGIDGEVLTWEEVRGYVDRNWAGAHGEGHGVQHP